MQESLVASSLARYFHLSQHSRVHRSSSKRYSPETWCDGTPRGSEKPMSLPQPPSHKLLVWCAQNHMGESRAVQWIHDSKVLEMQTYSTQPWEKVLVRVEEEPGRTWGCRNRAHCCPCHQQKEAVPPGASHSPYERSMAA